MNAERVVLPGMLCRCEADQQGIIFSPEFGKPAEFTYDELVAVKSREAQRLRYGRFVVVSKDGRSMSMKVQYKENRRMKRMLMFLMGQVPGDVTFRRLSVEEEKKAAYRKRGDTQEAATCPKCHSTDIQSVRDGRLTGRVLTRGRQICRRCGHQFTDR